MHGVAVAARRLAEEPHRAGRRPLESEDEPKQRRLAAAVRARHRDELALPTEVDVLEDAVPAGSRRRRPSSTRATGIRASGERAGSPA